MLDSVRFRLPRTESSRVGWLAGACFAHRGLHGAALPENSRAAFRAAVCRRLGIECDVHCSADGEAVVFHDFTLGRLTGAAGNVCARTMAELAKLPLADTAETIPSLDETLALVGGVVPLLIEVKARRASPIGRLCHAVGAALSGYRGAVAVMSFDPRVVAWFRRHRPAVPRGLVLGRTDHRPAARRRRLAAMLRAARIDFVALDVADLGSPFARRLGARGLPLAAWTVRSPAARALAMAHGAALIAEGAGLPGA